MAHILVGNGALEAAPIVGLRRVDEHQEPAVVEGLGKGVVGVQAKIPTRPSYGLQRQGVVHGVSAGVGVVWNIPVVPGAAPREAVPALPNRRFTTVDWFAQNARMNRGANWQRTVMPC